MNARDDQLVNGQDDQLVADYLRRLDAAAHTLPADRRNELTEEITAHISEARAAGPAGPGGPSGVRNILERLGDPADIVRAATETFLADPATGRAAAGSPGGDPSAPGSGGAGALEITAVILLLIGGIVVPIVGWIVGVVLVWISPRWRTRDKLLGTLVWPGGLLLPVGLVLAFGLAVPLVAYSSGCASGPSQAEINLQGQQVVGHAAKAASCSASHGPPGWLVIAISVTVLAAAIAGPVVTAVRLLRRARTAPV